jgi:hypothetical protein
MGKEWEAKVVHGDVGRAYGRITRGKAGAEEASARERGPEIRDGG